jgi:DNA-binding beta-propeller fold protein YncE
MKLLYCLLVLSLLSACVKDKPQEPVKSGTTINADSKVLVVNEGGFGYNNADITIYDPASGSITDNYYRQQNSNQALGDVCQSACKFNNRYYLMMNNSNEVKVVDADNFVKTAAIPGFNSPRYLLPLTYSKAYVSDLYASSIQIIDLNSNTITGNIPCMSGTEEMVMIYNKAFVTCSNSQYCYVINAATDAITDSIPVGKNATSLVIDRYSKLWVLAGGNSSQAGKLLRINPVTLQTELSLSFNLTDNANHLRINKTRDTLYYLNKGIHRFLISDSQLPSSPLVNQGTKVYYGLGVNPKDYTIYVSDAIDYVQKSKIEVYKPDGTLKSSFNAGVISNGFVFE